MNKIFDEYIDNLLSISNNKGKKYYSWIRDNSKVISNVRYNLSNLGPIINDSLLVHKLTENNQCFYNSGKLVFENGYLGDLYYCEGFYVINSIPIPLAHAWVRYKDEYYDLTYKKKENELVEYILVKELPYMEVLINMSKYKTWGPWVVDNLNFNINE